MIYKMNDGGKIALLSISPTSFSVDWNKVIFKMLSLKDIFCRAMFETWYKVIALLLAGLDLEGLITHRISICEFNDGFAAMISAKVGKVALDWD